MLGRDRCGEGFPLSVRLLREIHGVLLTGGRGSERTSGELRTSQNWIGGTRPGNAVYVPPPAHEVPACLADLKRFLHDEPRPTGPRFVRFRATLYSLRSSAEVTCASDNRQP